jgi:hypothetical protein
VSDDWAESYEPAPTRMRIEAYVWYCGDDWCNCSEAVLEEITPNPRVGLPWIERRRLWEGEFRTDGEQGATTDLNREAARLRRHHNALFHQIEWPWDRTAKASA